MKTKATKPREREIQANAIEWLRLIGWRAWRRNTGAMTATYKGRDRLVRFSEKGQSDIYGITSSGFHFELEIKRPGGWPTAAQIEWLRTTNGVGGSVSFWVDNLSDLERVVRHVEGGGTIRFQADTGCYGLVGP